MVSLVSLLKLNLFFQCVVILQSQLYFISTTIANKSISFRCVGKVIDNNDDAALLEEREELVERQDLGMRQRLRIKMLSIQKSRN